MKFLKGVGTVLFVVLVALILVIGYFKLGRLNDFKLQREVVETMAESSLSDLEEESFTDFSLDSDIYLNEIQLIATHNSYKKQPDGIRYFFVRLYSEKDAREIMYGHDPLVTQFDRGIRSIELDVRQRNDNLELTHVPLVDNRATSPDLALTLEEIKNWSDNNPDHIPLIVMIELKHDWEFLDPFLKPVTYEMLDNVDAAIREVFPDEQLILPDNVRHEGETLEESIMIHGWPTLKEVQGRIMFIMLPNEKFTNMYSENHENLEGRVLFTSSKADMQGSVVIFVDNPDVEKISELVKKNYIVRTRADANIVIDETRTENALQSGAQILSTDFPVGEPDEETQYVFSFGDGKTVRLNPVFE